MHCNDSTRFTRRTALRCLAGAAMSGLAACATTATGQSSFFARTGLPIGLQVYTLGEQAGQDIDATFAAIAAIGFREIELPGLLGHKPPQVRAAAQRACCRRPWLSR